MKSISIVWHVEDVLHVRPDLTELQALEVLEAAKHNHDATIGINWDVLTVTAECLFGEGTKIEIISPLNR